MAPRKSRSGTVRKRPSPQSPRSSTRSHREPHQGQLKREGMSMEAKVDVRKLQILNDRINQTIDALNQVRLSVHGLAHSGIQQMNPLGGFIGQGYGMQQGLGMQNPYLYGAQGPFQGIGGQLGQLSSQLGGQQGFQGFGGGLGFQHSPFLPQQNPFQQQNPFANPF